MHHLMTKILMYRSCYHPFFRIHADEHWSFALQSSRESSFLLVFVSIFLKIGDTALIVSSIERRYAIVKLLLEAGADINEGNDVRHPWYTCMGNCRKLSKQ